MQSNDMRIFICVISKTDPIQHKKSILTLKYLWRVILVEESCFPSAISVFFFGMFLIKIFSKCIRVEIRFDYGEWRHSIHELIHVSSRPPQSFTDI